MYSGVVQRVQIYLDDEELALLERAAERTGASRSELIRRAVRERYGGGDARSRLERLQVSAGAWTGRSFTGEEYVDAVRGDLNERLAKLGR